jgi:hypothetical protein
MEEHASGEDASQEERRLELPMWVPAAIGMTLVALAAMAVYTGFHTRVRPVESTGAVSPFTESDGLYPEDSGGPPGAPGPGGSRVSPDGEVPLPESLETAAEPGLSITGNATGVRGQMTIVVRRGLVFDVKPADAVIYVNDVAVGSARQFASADQAYEFAEEGQFSVRIAAPGYDEAELEVSAGAEAAEEIVEVSLHLKPAR